MGGSAVAPPDATRRGSSATGTFPDVGTAGIKEESEKERGAMSHIEGRRRNAEDRRASTWAAEQRRAGGQPDAALSGPSLFHFVGLGGASQMHLPGSSERTARLDTCSFLTQRFCAPPGGKGGGRSGQRQGQRRTLTGVGCCKLATSSWTQLVFCKARG